MINQMKEWSDLDHPIKAIVIKGSGRAFSCGGDLQYVAKCSEQGNYTAGATLLRLNFELDYMISELKKPCLTFIDGITFGGGSGLSMFSEYPICSERTIWSMPEVKIGYFPDCGASYLFANKINGGRNWGTILALRGQLLQSQQLIFTKIAPYYLQSKDWRGVERSLQEWTLSYPNQMKIESILDQNSASIKAQVRPLIEIFPVLNEELQSCFQGVEDVEHLLETFKQSAHRDITHFTGEFHSKLNYIWKQYANHTIQDLEQASPLSLKITYSLLNRVENDDGLKECINREWKVARNFGRIPNDLLEGVRAKLVEKDNKPKWKFLTLKSVDMELVEDFFKGWNDHDDLEQEITDTVLNGRQVLVLCYGQSKLAKRDLLFGTGVTNFGICPNLVGSILKGIRTNSRRGKIECGFWMISNGALTDLVSASSSTLFDAEALKTVDVESVGDMVALLNEYFPVEKAEEDHNHLFVRLRVDTDLEENLRGEICLLDVAGFPSLVSGTADQKGLLEESPEAPMRCKLAIHQRELKEFCFIISRLAKRIDGYSIPSFHFRTIFGKLLQKLMTQSSVYGLCCISEEPLNVLNTIASLRIAVRMQKIKTDHHSPKRQSAVHSFTLKK
eukprot:g5513.t1